MQSTSLLKYLGTVVSIGLKIYNFSMLLHFGVYVRSRDHLWDLNQSNFFLVIDQDVELIKITMYQSIFG